MRKEKIPYLIIVTIIIALMFFIANKHKGEFGVPKNCLETPLHPLCYCGEETEKTSHEENGRIVYTCLNGGMI